MAVVVLTLTVISLDTAPASATSGTNPWTLTTLSIPPGVVYSQPSAISCPSISYCVVVGVNGESGPSLNYPPTVWIMSDGAWSVQVLPMSPGDLLADPLGISCPSVGSCFAVGTAMTNGSVANNASTPVEWTLSNGVWSVGELAMLSSNSSEVGYSISCSSATNCVAVGANSTVGSFNFTPVEWTLSNDVWSVG